MGTAQRSAVARHACKVSERGDLLAAFATMGRARSVVGGLAQAALTAGPARVVTVARDVPGRELRAREKRGCGVGKTKRGKGTKWMVLVDGQGIPLGALLASASPHEVTLAEATLAQVRVPQRRGRPRQNPPRVIADKAYDSDPLRSRLKRRGIELIVPHKSNRRKPPTQDGRKLRRYRRRWKIERTNAWLGFFRRLTVRYDRILTVYQGFFHVACLMITLRYL